MMKNKTINNIGVISLGCAKNRVDCEVMIQKLLDAGYQLCDDYNACDAIIVNTCAFIGPAKEEAVQNILEAASYKSYGLKKLIVTGCLAQRYGNELIQLIPEIDAMLGVKNFDIILEALREEKALSEIAPLTLPSPEGPRSLTTENYSVYLKIAEGCSNRCAYCVIPSIRGDFMPRRVENILQEAKALAQNGAKEINIIAQDITRHPGLIEIIKGICAIDSVAWIRLLYLYPDEITPELIDLIAKEEKIVKYIDIPLQHAANPVLKRMNRRGTQKDYRKLIASLRKKIPQMALRTTFITGFPGETKQDFADLFQFIRDIRFQNLGVFPYSREEGTKAAGYCGQLSEKTKQRRAEQLMQLQYGILDEINQTFVGNTYTVLCEGEAEIESTEKNLYKGRAYFQAPEVDGMIYFTSPQPCKAGEFYPVTLLKYDCYDFYGQALWKES